jgi:hypothetical protein
MKAIDDIEKLLNAMRDRGAEMQAFETLLTEIGGSLADIVAIMEKPATQHKDDSTSLAAALTDGISKLKAPTVSVNVSPTPVTVKVEKAAAPVVHVMPQEWKTMRIKIVKDANGNKEFKITKE